MDEIRSFVVDRDGLRLDKYVSEQCPELSRTRIQKLIIDGHIRLNEHSAKAGLKLSVGDRITINLPPSVPSSLLAEEMPLGIVYEDDDLLVIDKPAGLTVHPAPGHTSHTLVNAILPKLGEVGDSLRPGIVHRLDKDTSGLIVVAKNSQAQMNLINQFKAHSVVKAYLVLVKGHLTPEQGIIEAAMGRDPRNRKRMSVVSQGREARTRYQVIKYIGDYSLLEARPETGRTHQIRVHLQAIGYPVVGDATYGVKAPFLSRQFLHACRLGFGLPSTGEYVEFKSELPQDLEQALKEIS